MFLAIPLVGALLVAALIVRYGGLFSLYRGSGEVVTEKRDVHGYSGVSLSGVGELSIDQNGTESLTVEAEDNIIPHIRTEVRDGILYIGFEGAPTPSPTKPIRFYLSAATLNKVAVSGAGSARAMRLEAAGLELNLSGTGSLEVRNLQTGKLSVDISGAGTVLVSGSAAAQALHLSGAGTYNGPDLASQTANAHISGAGTATVRVSDRLDAWISGAGSVAYIGNPAVGKKVTGVGSIRKLRDS